MSSRLRDTTSAASRAGRRTRWVSSRRATSPVTTIPLGALTKDEVRERARALGLATADKPESQEICFVPEDDYRSFLKGERPDIDRPGDIVAAVAADDEHIAAANSHGIASDDDASE